MERTDIDIVKQIPLADFLARLGHEPVRRSGNELWYRAPYRSERTPSFRVNVAKQLWYDFGLGKGDHLVLNSVANVGKAAGYLDGYGRIDCFLDRDEAGQRTLDALQKRYGGRVTDRSALYDGCKDLNEYLQRTTKKRNNNNLKIRLK